MPMSVIGAPSRRPATRISPSVGSVSPAVISISVLLPHPEGPISDTNSPPRIENETSSIAVNNRPFPGKRFVMRRPSIGAPLVTGDSARGALAMSWALRRARGQQRRRVVIGDRLVLRQLQVLREELEGGLPILLGHAAERGRTGGAQE